MKKLFLTAVFLVSMFSAVSAEAYLRMTKRDGALTVHEATTDEIVEIFARNNYEDYTKERGRYPRIYMDHMPTDWKDIKDDDVKHRLFIRIMLPLVLKINEEIAQERKSIEDLRTKFVKEKELTMSELSFLEQKAREYDVFTNLKGDLRTQALFRQLLIKVDAVPPSIMIATAAIYTDWGISRLAMTANSLYLDEVWYDDRGVVPLDDPEADYHYKAYETLADCIRARALLINSHINYEYLRESRRLSRQMKRPPYGEQLAAQMLNDSNLQNVAGLIDYTFTFYKLNRTDFFPELRDAK